MANGKDEKEMTNEDTPLVETQLRLRLINYSHSSLVTLESLAKTIQTAGVRVRDTNNSKDSIELIREILTAYEDMAKEIKIIDQAEKEAVILHNKLYGEDFRKK